jgi:hypothetical protein
VLIVPFLYQPLADALIISYFPALFHNPVPLFIFPLYI